MAAAITTAFISYPKTLSLCQSQESWAAGEIHAQVHDGAPPCFTEFKKRALENQKCGDAKLAMKKQKPPPGLHIIDQHTTREGNYQWHTYLYDSTPLPLLFPAFWCCLSMSSSTQTAQDAVWRPHARLEKKYAADLAAWQGEDTTQGALISTHNPA